MEITLDYLWNFMKIIETILLKGFESSTIDTDLNTLSHLLNNSQPISINSFLGRRFICWAWVWSEVKFHVGNKPVDRNWTDFFTNVDIAEWDDLWFVPVPGNKRYQIRDWICFSENVAKSSSFDMCTCSSVCLRGGAIGMNHTWSC
jgi:hypothetical protein